VLPVDVSLPLRVTLDPDADAGYVYLSEIPDGAAVTQRVVGVAGRGEVVLDFDEDGRLLGVELVGASSLLPPSLLDRLTSTPG
jgi:uncharacterized protein YuzE